MAAGRVRSKISFVIFYLVDFEFLNVLKRIK